MIIRLDECRGECQKINIIMDSPDVDIRCFLLIIRPIGPIYGLRVLRLRYAKLWDKNDSLSPIQAPHSHLTRDAGPQTTHIILY